jgi:putative hydrolase of the HAD superfamily
LPEPLALVVDFGGVLTTSLGDAFRAFCEREGVEYERVRDALREAYGDMEPDSLVARFEVGLIERQEFETHLAALLSRDLPQPLEPRGLIDRMLADVRIDRGMVAAIGAARRAGVRTTLLSNSWGVDYYPRDLLEGLFDHVLISGEVGTRKPHPDAFLLAAERLGLPPDRCVFVDDHDGNVKAAVQVGMVGVLHERTPETVARLEELLGLRLVSESDGNDRIRAEGR